MKAILTAIFLAVAAPAIGAEPAKGDAEFAICDGPDHINRCNGQWNKAVTEHMTVIGDVVLSPFVLVGILRAAGTDGARLSIDMPSEQACEREILKLRNRSAEAAALFCVDRRP